jgi:hypothetical protein
MRLLNNYIIRDILIWLFFIFLLPVILISVYYFTKSEKITINSNAFELNKDDYKQKNQLFYDYDNLKSAILYDEKAMKSKDTAKYEFILSEHHKDTNNVQIEDEVKKNSLLSKLVVKFNEKNHFMRRINLDQYESSLCNDGTHASYYIKNSKTKSKVWIILLEGGFFCYDSITCKQRSLNSKNLTSSTGLKYYKIGKIE